MPTPQPAANPDPYAARAAFYVTCLARIGKIINALGELPPEPMECTAAAREALARIAFLADADPTAQVEEDSDT